MTDFSLLCISYQKCEANYMCQKVRKCRTVLLRKKQRLKVSSDRSSGKDSEKVNSGKNDFDFSLLSTCISHQNMNLIIHVKR